MKFRNFYMIQIVFLGILGIMMLGSGLAADAIECKGLLVPCNQARIASRAKGVIAFIRADGDEIKKGEVLMALENTMEKLQVSQQQHLVDLRAFEWKAVSELRRKDAVSATEEETKRISHEIAKSQLEQAKEVLARSQVLAPFDGVVIERLHTAGEAVGEFVPVLVLADVRHLVLDIFLSVDKISVVKAGQRAVVKTDHAAGRDIVGIVEKVAPVGNAASGEFKVRILLENPNRVLKAGVPATALIATE